MILTLKSGAGPGFADVWAPRAARADDPSMVPGSSLENPRTSWDRIFEVEPTYTGKTVTEISALQLTAVWRCVNLISSAVAKTPFNVYQRIPGTAAAPSPGKQKAVAHYWWPLLHREANDQIRLSAYRFRRMMQTWLLLWGNAYAELEDNQRGQVIRVWPMRPDKMRVSGPAGNLVYTYTMADGTPHVVPAAYMLHLRGLETDGVMGLSPIRAARQTLGLAMAAEEYGARFFGSSGKPGGWISHQGKLNPTARANLRDSFEDMHRGLRGAHRVAIFEEGMQFHEVGVDPEDMQFLQTRQFQGIDIARLFGVPPHKIAELSRATFSNIEHQSMELLQDTLGDWFTNWEQEVTIAGLSEREAANIFLEFDRDHVVRADKKTRYDTYAIGIQNNILSPNDARDEENLNRITPEDGGDTYGRLVNTAPVGSSPETDPDKDPDDPGGNAGDPDPNEDPAATAAAAKKAKAKAKPAPKQPLSGGSQA